MKTFATKISITTVLISLITSMSTTNAFVEKINHNLSPKNGIKLKQIVIPPRFQTEAINTLQNGDLDKFDPLCGDTACQLRTIMITQLFKKQKTNTSLNQKEKRLLALSYLLTKTKQLIPGKEFLTEQLDLSQFFDILQEEGCNQQLKDLNPEHKTKLSIAIKQNVGSQAFDIFVSAINKLEKNDKELAGIKQNQKRPFFIKEFKEASSASNNIPTIPCTLSIQTLITLTQAHKIPVALIVQAEDSKHIIIIPNNKEILDETPIIIFEGTTKKLPSLKNFADELTSEGILMVRQPEKIDALNRCIIANAIQHPQIGSGNKNPQSIEQIVTKKVIDTLDTNNPLHPFSQFCDMHDADHPLNTQDLSKILTINKTELTHKTGLSPIQEAFISKCHTLLDTVEKIRPHIAAELEQFTIEHIFTTTGKKLLPHSTTQQNFMVNT